MALAATPTALLVRAVLKRWTRCRRRCADAATAIGYSRIAQMKVELPLSIPVAVAGLRVVGYRHRTVSVGSSDGIGGLGTWFTAKASGQQSDQIVAGVVAMFRCSALAVDVVINLAGRLATRHGNGRRGRPSAPTQVAARSPGGRDEFPARRGRCPYRNRR